MNLNRQSQLSILKSLKEKNESNEKTINEHVSNAYYSSLGTLSRIINQAEETKNEKN